MMFPFYPGNIQAHCEITFQNLIQMTIATTAEYVALNFVLH